MRLRRTMYGYVCASDGRIRFRRQGRGWRVQVWGAGVAASFPDLQAARTWARRHWAPSFIVDHVWPYPEAWALLQTACAEADEVSFRVLCDYLEEKGRRTDRKGWLGRARRAGMFRPERPPGGRE